MTNYFPIKPIYLTLLVLLSFFAVTHTSWLTILLLTFAIGQLIYRYPPKNSLKVLLIISCFTTYFFWLNQKNDNLSQHEPEKLQLISPIPDTISVNGDLLSFRGYSQGRLYQAYYTLSTKKEQTFFKTTSQQLQLNVEADLSLPEAKRNFNGFDYQAYLKSQGIYRIATIKTIQTSKPVQTFSPVSYLKQLRRKWIVFIQEHFPSPMKHYMTGLLLGHLDKEFDEMSDIYSQLGIIHLFALSGMQVGFFLKLFRQPLLRLGLTRETVNWLQVPFSVAYAILTGLSISVIRSLLQALFKQCGIKGLDNIALVLLLLFVVIPQKVMTVGGVLSFIYAFLLTAISFGQYGKYRAACYQTLTLAIGVLPFLTWYFGSFQPLSIILTALLSLIFDSLMLPILSIAFMISPLMIINHINPLFIGLEKTITAIATWSGNGMVLGIPTAFLGVALIISLAFLSDRIRQQKRYMGLLLITICCFSLIKHPLENEVTIVDIGQGDSIFIRDMSGNNLLIDVGGRVTFSPKEDWRKRHQDANAKRTLIPYLKSRGVAQIEQLLLTHTDTDHIGDLEEVAKHIKIKQILVSPGSLTQPKFVKRLKDLNIPVVSIKAGHSIDMMGSRLHVLYPMQVGDGSNDDSLVLYGKLLNKRFLFTGDLEEDGEKTIMVAYPNLKVDILKAGHHGSKGSSLPDFLDHIQPEISLISAGKNNRYQHPHQETLDRFAERHITVYRTDQEGAIRFRGITEWQLETVH